MVEIFAVWNLKTGSSDVANVPPPPPPGSGRTNSPAPPVNETAGAPDVAQVAPSFTESKLPAKELQKLAVHAGAKAGQREIRPDTAYYQVPANAPAADTYLPGEESYVRTISDLKQNVDSQKDSVMTPSSRVSYERDMAMVNDSIKRMREVVKKNPRTQAARQVLYSSYQDKIDLLNSVSQREELMASLR